MKGKKKLSTELLPSMRTVKHLYGCPHSMQLRTGSRACPRASLSISMSLLALII